MKFKSINDVKRSKLFQGIVVVSTMTALQILVPSSAFAADGLTSISQALTTVNTFLTGTLGRVVAVSIVCFLGLLAFIGRLSLPILFQVVVGMAFIFGASSIVSTLMESGN